MINKTALLIMGVLLSGCTMAGYKNPSSVSSIATPTMSVAVISIEPRTITISEQSKSGQSGNAVFKSEGDKTRVVLTLSGKGVIGPLPAHIHRGSCPNPGAVVYPLMDIVNGKSETVVDVPMASLFGSESMAVNVHKSMEEATIYTGCGDLK